jgi:hypothetical protein
MSSTILKSRPTEPPYRGHLWCSFEKASDTLYRNSDSYSRMEMVLKLRQRMDYGDWLRLLGENWNGCDNIRDYRLQLKKILGTNGPLLPMMTPEDQTAYAALPDVLTVYRGCSAQFLLGASWTLNKELAMKFPTLNRYGVKDPVLVTATVKKENVLAFNNDRQESEIITFSAKRIGVASIV